jgi:hypothetical protein
MLITNVGYNFTYRWNIPAQQLIDKIKFGKSLLPNSRTLINISRGEINLCTYKIQNDICMILEEAVEDRWRHCTLCCAAREGLIGQHIYFSITKIDDVVLKKTTHLDLSLIPIPHSLPQRASREIPAALPPTAREIPSVEPAASLAAGGSGLMEARVALGGAATPPSLIAPPFLGGRSMAAGARLGEEV